MESSARVTRSLRRRLNSIDVDINSGSSQTSEIQFLKEDILKTPTRKNLLSEEIKSETPVTEKTSVTRSGRRRSIDVNSSPALTGTPLRRTRRNSTSYTDEQNENISSAKKNLQRSLIPDIAEENEQLAIDNGKDNETKQKLKKVLIKVEKLKNLKSKSTNNYDQDETLSKTSEEELSMSEKNMSSPKISEENNVNYNKDFITNEMNNTKELETTSNETKTGEKNEENDDLMNKTTFENKESVDVETSISNSNSSIKLQQNMSICESPGTKSRDFASNTASKKVSLNKENSFSSKGTADLSYESEEVVPSSQLGQKKHDKFSTESNFNVENNDYSKENEENGEQTNNFNKSSTLKDITLTNRLDKNTSSTTDITENNISKSFAFKLSSPEFGDKSVNSNQHNEKILVSEQNQVKDKNETDIKMKSVTFNDSGSNSERDNSKFRKTPIACRNKNIVLDRSTNSENNDSPTKLNTLENYKITSNHEKLQSLFDNMNTSKTIPESPNNVKKSSIASSTPLNTLISVNSKKKTNLLSEYKIENIQETNKLSKSWSQSVKGTSKDKIDKFCISLEEKLIVPNNSKIGKKSWKQKSTEFDDENENSKDTEKDDKNVFIDDEAVESSNEGSLSDEERQYLEENEIQERGISLGSEDTTQSSSEDSAEEDDSFIDNEENNELLSTDPEEYLLNSPSKGKLYRKNKFKNFGKSNESSESEEILPHIEKSLNKSNNDIQNRTNSAKKDKTSGKWNDSSSKNSENKDCFDENNIKTGEEVKEVELGKNSRKSSNVNITEESFKENLNAKDRKTPSKSPKTTNDSKLNKFNESLNNNEGLTGLTLDVTKFADQSSSESEEENINFCDKDNKLNKSKNTSTLKKIDISMENEIDKKKEVSSETEFHSEKESSRDSILTTNFKEQKEVNEIKNSSLNLNFKSHDLNVREATENNTNSEKSNLNNAKESPDEDIDLHSSYMEELKITNETLSVSNICRNSESDNKIEQKLTKKLSNTERNDDQKESKQASFLEENNIKKTEEMDNSKSANISHILKRCNDILHAAYEAKLQSKKKKKNELKSKAKTNRKLEETKENEKGILTDGDKIKIENKKAISKGIQHAAVLLNKARVSNENIKKEKMLPMEVIDAISKKEIVTAVKTQKRMKNELKRKYETDQEDENNKINIKKYKVNSSQKSKLIPTPSGIFVEEPITPRKRKISKIELPTGTVYEEPVTPTASKQKSGFIESPITPLGFKVRNILSAGQKEIPELKLNKKSKRKIIDEPVNVLPKTVWSSSGEFIEETYNPIKNQNETVFTEFYAVPIKTKKIKTTPFGYGIINEKVIQFKQQALSSTNNCRETSKQLLQRKERSKFYYK
ncbi:protein PF3D7_1417600-like isoform X2 [Condylostylus longicornis]|uniref:protein PF3D7_1417600-like isoform X2 n=1 Tax=Condylostylus longicornis TaxID=2530218 RepID=UPI00244DCDF8|nr:protein PF3D7_1417600-like isoform X2 [Condylostylus longicornis]